jgi:hypothetical protein
MSNGMVIRKISDICTTGCVPNLQEIKEVIKIHGMDAHR